MNGPMLNPMILILLSVKISIKQNIDILSNIYSGFYPVDMNCIGEISKTFLLFDISKLLILLDYPIFCFILFSFKQSTSSGFNPDELLKNLEPRQQQLFLQQFGQLTVDQQVYAYNQVDQLFNINCC